MCNSRALNGAEDSRLTPTLPKAVTSDLMHGLPQLVHLFEGSVAIETGRQCGPDFAVSLGLREAAEAFSLADACRVATIRWMKRNQNCETLEIVMQFCCVSRTSTPTSVLRYFASLSYLQHNHRHRRMLAKAL